MLGRRNTLEEKLAAAIKEEFAGIITNLEEDRLEYRRRLALKKETRGALEDAEAEVRRLHSERITLKERFWEAYYGKGGTPFSEVETEPRSLGRAIERAERTLRKARQDFEKADFDEVAEGSRLVEEATTAKGEVERRTVELEKSLREALAGVRRNVEKANQTLRDEIEVDRPPTEEEQDVREEDAEPYPRASEDPETTTMPHTARPAQPRRSWWFKRSRKG